MMQGSSAQEHLEHYIALVVDMPLSGILAVLLSIRRQWRPRLDCSIAVAVRTGLTISPQPPVVAAGTVQQADKEIAVEVVAQRCTSSEIGTEENDAFEILVDNQAGTRMKLAALVL